MKKCYIGGKFNLKKDNNLVLMDKLKDDIRSQIIGKENLTIPKDELIIKNTNIIYSSPFYSEEADNK